MRKCIKLLLGLTILLFSIGAYSQQRQIKGQVISLEDGLPLPGATVILKGTQEGTSTDMDGNFEIQASLNQELEVSYIGYDTQTVRVGSSSFYKISLKISENMMDELVVIGYGVQKKSEVTGAITQVKGDEISGLVTPSFDSQLAGRSAGVQVTTAGGVIGEAPKINIRGLGSISSGTTPLIVLDGVPLSSNDLEINVSNNILADINPQDIESFEILKDGAATAIYGSRAANGVIMITTKRGKKILSR